MSIRMSETVQEERLRWIMPIVRKEVKLTDVAKVCPYSERSLKRWKKLYLTREEEGLTPLSTAPKSQPNEISIRVKEEVITLRKNTGLRALKLHWRLKKKGLVVSVSTIGKIVKNEGLTRKYRVKKVKYKIY